MSGNLMEQYLDDSPIEELSKEVFRGNIEAAEGIMLSLPQLNLEPVHRFADGLYCRQLTMPAGSLIMSRVHKYENYAFIMSGSCTVVSELGKETFHAPFMMKTYRGTKRLLLIHEECTWITVHALPPGLNEASDIQEIEDYYACNTLEEFDKHLLEAQDKGVLL